MWSVMWAPTILVLPDVPRRETSLSHFWCWLVLQYSISFVRRWIRIRCAGPYINDTLPGSVPIRLADVYWTKTTRYLFDADSAASYILPWSMGECRHVDLNPFDVIKLAVIRTFSYVDSIWHFRWKLNEIIKFHKMNTNNPAMTRYLLSTKTLIQVRCFQLLFVIDSVSTVSLERNWSDSSDVQCTTHTNTKNKPCAIIIFIKQTHTKII